MSATATKRSTPIVAILAIVGLGVGAAAYWSFLDRSARSSSEAGNPKKRFKVSLVVSGDTAGWIVPCGCTSNQSGGLLRRATYIESLRGAAKSSDDEAVEIVVADVGGAPGGTSLYEKLKFEAILKGEKAMGITAHNIGAPEAKLGADYLKQIKSELEFPFISANLLDKQGQRIFDSYRIVNYAGRRMALVGVLSQKFKIDGLQVADPKAAILATLDEVRKADMLDDLIVLAYLPADELRALAADLPEAAIVVGGPTGQAIAPVKNGKRWLAAATNKGKFIARFSIDQPQLTHHDADYNFSEAKVVRTLADWNGEMVELNSTFADHPDQQRNMDEFYAVLAEKDVEASQTGFVPLLPADAPADFRIAGTAACADCHEGDCRLWEQTTHAHAWETLSSRGAHVDAYCQQCHTTGYGQAGGFLSAKKSGNRVNVGCESCHGPSTAHVERPEKRTPFVARDQCTRCHDHENSPKFAYATYWAKIVHGNDKSAGNAKDDSSQDSSEPKP